METNQYKTISKFDRGVAGLLDGNNLHTKPTTIEHVENVTGEAETFIIQTIRTEAGNSIVLKFIDNSGVLRVILPPKVVNTLLRHCDSLSERARSNSSSAVMKNRIAAGEDPAAALREYNKNRKKKGGSK